MSDEMTEYSAEWWAKEVSSAEKELDAKWRTSADKIVNRYLDVRDDGDGIGALLASSAKKYNVFWANTQILKSALYATPPKPVVKRLHDDAADDEARVGALMLQRIVAFGIDKDNSDMHRAFQNATEDRLIPGLGQVWLRLRTETESFPIEAITDPNTGQEIEPAGEGERIINQEVCTDYVHWRDFVWSPARTWEEVSWVGRRVWMTKRGFVERFGKEAYTEIKEQMTGATVKNEFGYPKGFEKGRVQVLELWCKETKKAYWVHETCKVMLDERDDPIKLRDFFPCPMPLLATHTTNSIVPRPDFVMVQDQYEELDVLNDRISTLTRALRIVGAYDQSNVALSKMLTGSEFQMIPVDNWAMLAERGGIKGVVDWFPVEQVSKVLQSLIEIRPLIVAQIYELTSISDIMRGGSNPRETLGAQKLKAQYSSVRLRLTQQDVALFVTSAMKIKCEIIAKHMVPEEIMKQSAIQYTESAQFAQQGLSFIKNLEANQFRIEISEESLSMADYTAERELRIAYLTAVGQFLSQAGQMVVEYPAALPYISKMIAWVTASFRGSDDIETALDAAIKAAQEAPPKSEGEPKEPDHSVEIAQAKSQADAAKSQADAQMHQSSEQAKVMLQQQKLQHESEEKAKDRAHEIEVTRIEAALKIILQNMADESKASQAETDAENEAATAAAETGESDEEPLDQAKLLSEMVAKLGDPLTKHAESLTELAKSIATPRRRTPVRDPKTGDILYSDETPMPEGE